MTEPHPQRCIHYDVCWFVHQHSRCPDDEPTEYEKSLPDCRFDTRTHTPAAPAERLCDDCNIIELEEKVMHLEQQVKDERENVLKALQKRIDNPDSREGCELGMMSVASLVNWMSAMGYDCD